MSAQQLTGLPKVTADQSQKGIYPSKNLKNFQQPSLKDPILTGPEHLDKKLLLKTPQGGGSDGGQFVANDSDFQHITNTIELLAGWIENTPRKVLDDLSRQFNVNIRWSEFAQIIRETEFMPLHNAIGETFKGRKVYKIMHYDLENRKIIALQPFFGEFKNLDISTNHELLPKMRKYLLHEASHLFGIGINKNTVDNNDLRSRDFANIVYKAVSLVANQCGIFGSLDERARNCNLMEGMNLDIEDTTWRTIYKGFSERFVKKSEVFVQGELRVHEEVKSKYLVTSTITHDVRTTENHPQKICDLVSEKAGNSSSKWEVPTPQEMSWLMHLNLLSDDYLFSGASTLSKAKDTLSECFISTDYNKKHWAVCPGGRYINLGRLSPAADLFRYFWGRISIICLQRQNQFQVPVVPMQEMTTDYSGIFNDIIQVIDGSALN